MLINYINSALRNLRRQKLFALINVIGLSIGLASCTLIILFVKHEYSYDQNFADIDRLYRIETTSHIPGQKGNDSPRFFGPAYDLLPDEFEEIDKVVRLQRRGGTLVREENSIQETLAYADPEFLTVFDFPLLEGDRQSLLDEPAAMVLTEEMAIKHLGEPPWLGRTIIVHDTFEREHKVTGVIETLPGNTHFDIDILLPVDERVYENQTFGGATDLDRWNGLPFFVYVKLKKGRSIDGIKMAINDWIDKHFPPAIQALVGISGSELFTPRIIPVRDIHMYSPNQFDMRASGSLTTILSFSGISVLILVIACINFMNLATAAYSLRAKEIALRKVMGARRIQMFGQFQIESIITTFLALVIALAIIEMILPSFSNYTNRELTTYALLEPRSLLVVVALTVIVGIFAGFHPAFIMSGFRPGAILQSNQSKAGKTSNLRTLLVLLQFSISAGLIIVTLLIYIQTDHARTRDLGYENGNVLAVRGLGGQRIQEAAETVQNVVNGIQGVTLTSLSSFSPGDGQNVGLSLKVPGIDERVIIFYRSVYPSFFQQFDVKPVAGRLLDESHSNDRTVFIDEPDSVQQQSVNVVINEAAVQKLGFNSPEDAIGKSYFRGSNNQIVSTIVGVTPDTHFGSPRNLVDAKIFMFIPADITNLLVTYEKDQIQVVSEEIETKLKKMFPREQIQVQHLRDNIADQYREEEIQSTLLAMFTGLAILIACLGLFGLASFTITGRTREIGIRKVMGATPSQIIALLLTQFSKPVFLANIVAWPVCWLAISRWLTEFSHRIELLPWFVGISVVAALITVLLAWLTIAAHAYRVARTSPIFALRHE